MERKSTLKIAILSLLMLSCTASFAVTNAYAAEKSWHSFSNDDYWLSNGYWGEGHLIRTLRGTEYWQLNIYKDGDDVSLTIMIKWNPNTKTGTVYTFIHKGEYLYWRGWKGTIEHYYYVPYDMWCYIIHLSGKGIGSYGPDSHFGDAFVRGSMDIVWYPEQQWEQPTWDTNNAYIETYVASVKVTYYGYPT